MVDVAERVSLGEREVLRVTASGRRGKGMKNKAE